MASHPGPPSTLDLPPPPPLRVVETLGDVDVSRNEPAPVCLGRFALIGQVGRGGMGVVYAAWDPQLDRRVAIKVVDASRFTDRDEARHRLEQEARAAATLNHPNIVTIYDVGVHEGLVFLAMEYVQGCTLGTWLRQAKRPWGDVLAMFLQVGRGLAAAHAVGLIHRDFKPDNVLVETDDPKSEVIGRPRVADFGLAYSLEDRPGTRSGSSSGGYQRRSSERGATPAVAGTPAYMAPEQFDGVEIGPAADQFAFCVALFEALFGRRPFTGNSFQALSLAVRGGIEVPTDRPAVPRAIVTLLLRGLDPEPEKRHASVEALLSALDRVLHARRRRWLATSGAVVAGLALLVGYRAAVAVAPQPCAGADDASVLWTASERDAIAGGLGVAVAGPVVHELDRYADAFTAKRREVCEASRVRGEQSDESLALRMACLERVAGRFAGLTGELGGGGDVSRIDGDTIATRLPDLAMCDDVETLAKLTNRHAARSSRSSTEQDRAWALGVELVERALTRRLLGRADARGPAEEAATVAEANDLPGVHSRALSVLADLELEAGRPAAAERLRREAVRYAVADGHDDAAVYLMLDQADAALLDERIAEAELHLAYFDAFVDRMADTDARADVLMRATIVRGRMALAHGHAADAERILAALPTASMSELDRRATWMALGTAQRAIGNGEDARATWTLLLELVESLRGVQHPDVAAVLSNLALVHLDDRDAAAADVLLARAESLTLATLGERAPMLAAIATNRGWAARLARRHGDARHQLERALAIGREVLGPRHPSLAYALDQLGELDRELGRLDAAIEHFGAAGELRDAALGADHPETATTLLGMAKVFVAQGKPDRGRAAAGAALRIVDAHPGAPRQRAEIEAVLAAIGESAANDHAARRSEAMERGRLRDGFAGVEGEAGRFP